MMEDSLPAIYNGLFATSGMCESCHGHDPDGIASVSPLGEDVNVVDAWRSTMMANSSKDPYWRAKMRQEILTNPQHEEEIGNFCTKCHAPLGRHAMETMEVDSYTFNHMLTDTSGLDGVGCVACHQQTTENLGNEHSGELHFSEDPVAYGPFESPLISPMALQSGYIPEYSEHISDAGICAGCHTLITGTVDLDGNSTGTTFVEQATYHEWLNSDFADDQLNVTCQNCHMPDLGPKFGIQLAAGYETPPRAPFSKHTLAGANTLMLEIMKDNRDTLGIIADAEDYDATIAATYEQLQQLGLDLNMELTYRDQDLARFKVVIENRAGHKFPSGYPARRLFVQFELSDDNGAPLFTSGEWDEDFYLLDEDEVYEPHHDVISNEDQVQIYEMVMADVNGDPTTVLERADDYLKDNRLVPAGFSTQHAVYDTTLMVGNVLADLNFNRFADGQEGSGTDTLFFEIPMNNYAGELNANASVYYQSIPPKWTEELFVWEDDLIDHFQEMYDEADKTPVLIDAVSVEDGVFVSIEEMQSQLQWDAYFANGQLNYRTNEIGTLDVYSIGGKQIGQYPLNNLQGSIGLQVVDNVYLLVFKTKHDTYIQKIYIH